MTILKQLSTTTQPDGTAVTAGPGNSNYSSLTTGAGNTHTFRDTAKMGASAGYRMTNGGTNPTIAYTDLDSAVNDFEFRIEFSWDGTLTGTTVIGRGYSETAHVDDLWSFSLTTSGRLQFVEKITGGLNVMSPSTAGTTMSNAGEYTLIGQVDVATGTLSIDAYTRGSTTKLFTLSGTLVGTVPTRSFRWSIGSGTTGMTALDTNSNFAVGTGGKLTRADIASSPPVVTISPFQNVAAGAAVTASVSATDDGSIASYAWSVVSAASTSTPTLTGASTSSVSFTAPAAGNLVTLQCVVTDNLGLSTTGTHEVRVPVAASATAVPLALNGTSSGMTRVGTATTDGAALADASDATFMETGTLSSTEQWHEFRWQPSSPRSSAQMSPIRLGTDAGTATATVYLLEGATVRQTWTQAITATPTDYTFTLSSATLAAIGDSGNLRGRVGFTS